jgi:hypothetical protein
MMGLARGTGAACAALLAAAAAQAIEGTVTTTEGDPIPNAFVSLLGEDYSFRGYAITNNAGVFEIEADAPNGRLVVQPPAKEDAEGIGIYEHMPRIFAINGAPVAKVQLPEAETLVIRAYDAEGELMRWEDFEANGTFGGQFMYVTDHNHCMQEAIIWPAHDAESRAQESPREKGLPAVVIPKGEGGRIQVLYWPVAGYGKLLVNFHGRWRSEDSNAVLLNDALTLEAMRSLREKHEHKFVEKAALNIGVLRQRFRDALLVEDEAARAKLMDPLLGDILREHDRLEFADAKARIAAGEVNKPDWTLGAFEGGQQALAQYEWAAEHGPFDLATVLLGWSWTDLGRGTTPAQIDAGANISALIDAGYEVKTHGVVWLQELGILPERAKRLAAEDFIHAQLDQLDELLQAFGGAIDLWEAMNEPANVNTIGLARQDVLDLMAAAAQSIRKSGNTALVNNGHEADYGNKYTLYTLDGEPVNNHKQTFLEFLKDAQEANRLDEIDVIGLQFYPGAQLADRLGGVEGPAMTVAWFADTLDRYAALGKPIHITECSFPSTYGSGWKSGYWREPWNEQTQADYLERILTIAYAHPAVQSFTWWDISDLNASVVSGGLRDNLGVAKPAFGRLSELTESWRNAGENTAAP